MYYLTRYYLTDYYLTKHYLTKYYTVIGITQTERGFIMSVTTSLPPQKARTTIQNIGLILAFIVLGSILLLPTPETLSTGGHRMIGVLAFAIILWMTSAVSYPVSATMITALTALLLGFSPNPEAPAKAMGTANALKLIISGYSSPAMILVGAAMFISVAMRKTGLDRRIAMLVLSSVGTKVSRIYLGVIITGLILAFFVPSATARIGLVFSFVAIGSYLAAAGLPRLHAKWSFRTLILVAGFCYTLPLAFLASVPGLWLCAVPLFVSGAAQGLSLPIINDNVALLGTPDDRAAILAVSETSVRVSQSVSPLLFSIISMKWLWDGAYASGFAVGILILLVAFFVFEPRTAPSQK